MKKKQLSLTWSGVFLELCMSRVSRAQKARLDAILSDSSAEAYRSSWYENVPLLKSLFAVDNWWSVDDLDHSMGFVFKERAALVTQLANIRYTLDGLPVTVDPDALELSFYAPESIKEPLTEDDRVIAHGARRQAELHFSTLIDSPFDPSLITLSSIAYPEFGVILIDLDYDGHDDIQYTWGEAAYLKPRFFGKDYFHDASRQA